MISTRTTTLLAILALLSAAPLAAAVDHSVARNPPPETRCEGTAAGVNCVYEFECEDIYDENGRKVGEECTYAKCTVWAHGRCQVAVGLDAAFTRGAASELA